MIRRWAAVTAALLLSLLACLFFACGGPVFSVGSGIDSGVVAVVPSDAGDAAVTRDSATEPEDAAVVHVIYVSTSGSDSNTGYATSVPKQTLAAAIAAAAALDAGVEVHACSGTYIESVLDLSGAVSLRGGYACSTWTRTATFGFPTFDRVNETIVQNGNASSQAQTLVVSGTAAPMTVVDGLTIEGAATLNATTTGLLVTGQATPLVTDDIVTGGAGHAATGDGSIGISIQGGAAPEVAHVVVNGGAGIAPLGSVGILIDSTGTPNVHDDVVSGGLGTTTLATGTAAWGIGILSSAATPNALANDTVVACDSAGVIGTSIGINVSGADASVDITSSQVSGCSGAGDGGSSIGIRVGAPGTDVRILGDRAFGGQRMGPSAFTTGIDVVSAAAITVQSSMLHAGESSGAANGLSLVTVAGASIVDDTIYAGATNGTAIVLQPGATGARITDSILLGGGVGQTHAGVFVNSCAAGSIASLDHDLFANSGGTLYDCNQPDGGPAMSATTIEGLSALFPTESAGDLLYAKQAACGDGGCVVNDACPGSPAACLGQLFGASWTADDGITGLFSQVADGGVVVGGWMLPPGSPCAIAQGGIPVPGVTTDLYGVTRSATTPTLGAAELTGTCSP